MLVSAKHQHESATGIHTSRPPGTSLPPPNPFHPLDGHTAPACAPWVTQQISTGSLFHVWNESVSRSVVSDSLRPHWLYFCPWNSPGQNSGVGCYSLLQGIFLTQGLVLGLPPHRQMPFHLTPRRPLSILHMVVCMFPRYPLSVPPSPPSPLCPQVCSRCRCLSPLLPYK